MKKSFTLLSSKKTLPYSRLISLTDLVSNRFWLVTKTQVTMAQVHFWMKRANLGKPTVCLKADFIQSYLTSYNKNQKLCYPTLLFFGHKEKTTHAQGIGTR